MSWLYYESLILARARQVTRTRKTIFLKEKAKTKDLIIYITVTSIFISYTHTDKDIAGKIIDKLTRSGIDVWVDENDLPVGAPIIKEISEAIKKADFFLVIISKNAVNSTWVRRELSLALTEEIDKGNIKVLPVRTDDTIFPASLKDKKYADFRNVDMFNQSFDQLLSSIGIIKSRNLKRRGMIVEWNQDGPKISKNNLFFTSSDLNKLKKSYTEYFLNYMELPEETFSDTDLSVFQVAHFGSAINAFADIFNIFFEMPELELNLTENAQKFNLFYEYMTQVHIEGYDLAMSLNKRARPQDISKIT